MAIRPTDVDTIPQHGDPLNFGEASLVMDAILAELRANPGRVLIRVAAGREMNGHAELFQLADNTERRASRTMNDQVVMQITVVTNPLSQPNVTEETREMDAALTEAGITAVAEARRQAALTVREAARRAAQDQVAREAENGDTADQLPEQAPSADTPSRNALNAAVALVTEYLRGAGVGFVHESRYGADEIRLGILSARLFVDRDGRVGGEVSEIPEHGGELLNRVELARWKIAACIEQAHLEAALLSAGAAFTQRSDVVDLFIEGFDEADARRIGNRIVADVNNHGVAADGIAYKDSVQIDAADAYVLIHTGPGGPNSGDPSVKTRIDGCHIRIGWRLVGKPPTRATYAERIVLAKAVQRQVP